MANYNKCIFIGNITRDPQLKYLPSQTAVVELGIAVNKKWKTKQGEAREDVLFLDCKAFGKQAEVINQYFSKGKPIMLEGELRLDSWDDKQTGQKRTKHYLNIDKFEFMGGGSGDEADQTQPTPARRRPTPSRERSAAPTYSNEQQFQDEDIPF